MPFNLIFFPIMLIVLALTWVVIGYMLSSFLATKPPARKEDPTKRWMPSNQTGAQHDSD